MTSLDEIAPSFLRAKNRWPDAQNLQTHYEDLSSTFENKGCSLIELCKSFLEMICRTLLIEFGEDPLDYELTNIQNLLRITLEKLGINHTRGSCGFNDILSGCNKIAVGITDVRNHETGVAHGRDGFLDPISYRHAKIYLLAIDTILTLILDVYDGIDLNLQYTREPHSRFNHLNVRIDSCMSIDTEVDEEGMLVVKLQAGSDLEGFDLRISPSELLYNIDRQAYITILDSLRVVAVEEIEEEIIPEEKVLDITETIEEKVTEFKATEPKPEEQSYLVTEYKGKYSAQINILYEYVYHTLLDGRADANNVQNLVYTLLFGMEHLAVIDWSKKESTQAAVRKHIKKSFKVCSSEIPDGKSIVESIFKFLADNISGEIE